MGGYAPYEFAEHYYGDKYGPGVHAARLPLPFILEDQLLLHSLHIPYSLEHFQRWLAVQNFAAALLLLPIRKLVASRSIVRYGWNKEVKMRDGPGHING